MENFDYQSILVDSGSIVHWLEKSTPPPVLELLFNISYVIMFLRINISNT